MDPEKIRKHLRATKEDYEKNAKRREMYHNMPLAEKNALLLQRRLKKKEATTKRLLANTNSAHLVEPTCINQNNVNVECSSPISRTELTGCEVFVPPNVLQKEKNIVCPFGVFEKGSTSGSSNEPHAPGFKTASPAEHVKKRRHCREFQIMQPSLNFLPPFQWEFHDFLTWK